MKKVINKNSMILSICFLLFLVASFKLTFSQRGTIRETKCFKAGYTTCYDNYCEGEFLCLAIGGCSIDEQAIICVEKPTNGCYEIYLF